MTAPRTRGRPASLALPAGPPPRPRRDRGAEEPFRRPSLTVVEGGRVRHDRVRLLGAVALTTTVLGLFGAVSAHVALTEGQFRLEQLEARSALEHARYDRLRLQVAELESPERIVAEATQRLGMVAPSAVTYLAAAPPPAVDAAARPLATSAAAQPLAASAGDRPGVSAGEPPSPAPTSAWSSVKRQLTTR